jgi:uncharacterized membrane protein
MSQTPPPPAGPPPGSAPPPPPGGPRLDIGAAASYGWKKFTQYPGQLILIFLVVFVVQGVFQALSWAVDSFVAQAALGIIGFLVGQIVALGIIRAALIVTAGGEPDVSQVFKTDKLGDYIVASILFFLMWVVGLFICFVGAIVVSVLFGFYGFYILDRGLGPTEALGASYRLVTGNLGPAIGLLIVAFLIYIVGVIACIVGLLVSAPVAVVMVAYGYRVLNGEPVAP